MSIWETMKFGLHTISLKRGATNSHVDIERVQRGRLETLVQHARRHSSYYQEKFAGIDSRDFKLADLATSNKADLMRNFDDVLTVQDVSRAEATQFITSDSNRGHFFHDKYVLSHTSGSQGQPLLLVQPKENLELLFALQASRGNCSSVGPREAARRLLSPARLAAVTLKPGFYPSATALQHIPQGAQSFVKLMWGSLSDSDIYCRLQEFQPTHLIAYASVLHELARQIEQGHLSLGPALQQVINISERLLSSARERYERVFGVPVFNDYGMGECLFLSNGCQTSNGMHVNADWSILEVVDEDNLPVPDGVSGSKVLLTNLANYVQPIIRYEIGDIVTMATEPCGCGSNLPLIASVDGRDSDMFYVDTVTGLRPVSPLMFEFAMLQILDAREYQIIQEEPNWFRVLVEPLSAKGFDLEQAHQMLRDQIGVFDLGPQVQVDLEIVDRLVPEGESKFKRAISKVREKAGVAI